MAAPRYAVLGLAPARAAWLRELAQWANSSSLPVALVKCVSAEEVRAWLAGPRRFSAVLVDGSHPGLERDLLGAGRDAGCALIVVDERRATRDWRDIGADAVLTGPLERGALLGALGEHGRPVEDAAAVEPPTEGREPPARPPAEAALLVGVCGPGGTGASTVAMAAAQGLAAALERDTGARRGRGPRRSRLSPNAWAARAGVLLADLNRRGDQAVLHESQDLSPGIQELVEAHRTAALAPAEVVAGTFDVAERGYHLLLGLRRPAAWSAIRPRAFDAALASLCGAYRIVVCDLGPDLEGEADAGSRDVQERNHMSRRTLSCADLSLVVGCPGPKGLHSLAGLLADLLGLGVAPERIVPVVNRCSRRQAGRAARAETAAALRELLGETADAMAPTLHIAEQALDERAPQPARLPSGLASPLAAAVRSAAERAGRHPGAMPERPQPVEPGSLGSWTDQPNFTEGFTEDLGSQSG